MVGASAGSAGLPPGIPGLPLSDQLSPKGDQKVDWEKEAMRAKMAVIEAKEKSLADKEQLLHKQELHLKKQEQLLNKIAAHHKGVAEEKLKRATVLLEQIKELGIVAGLARHIETIESAVFRGMGADDHTIESPVPEDAVNDLVIRAEERSTEIANAAFARSEAAIEVDADEAVAAMAGKTTAGEDSDNN